MVIYSLKNATKKRNVSFIDIASYASNKYPYVLKHHNEIPPHDMNLKQKTCMEVLADIQKAGVDLSPLFITKQEAGNIIAHMHGIPECPSPEYDDDNRLLNSWDKITCLHIDFEEYQKSFKYMLMAVYNVPEDAAIDACNSDLHMLYTDGLTPAEAYEKMKIGYEALPETWERYTNQNTAFQGWEMALRKMLDIPIRKPMYKTAEHQDFIGFQYSQGATPKEAHAAWFLEYHKNSIHDAVYEGDEHRQNKGNTTFAQWKNTLYNHLLSLQLHSVPRDTIINDERLQSLYHKGYTPIEALNEILTTYK